MDYSPLKNSPARFLRKDSLEISFYRFRAASAGFTLLEMLVVVAIISFVIGVVVVNQRSFDNSVILSTTAYDVALSIRQAQAYGTAGLGVQGVPGGSAFPVSYGTGIDFSLSSPRQYIIFADTDPAGTGSCYPSSGGGGGGGGGGSGSTPPVSKTGDCLYTPPSGTSGDKIISKVTVNNGISISKLCFIKSSSSSWNCVSPSGGPGTFSRLNIVYARGDVTNHISHSGGSTPSTTDGTQACIELASPDGSAHEAIKVNAAGVISVDRNTCP